MCGHPEGDIIEVDFNLKSVGFGSGTGYGIGFTELFREPTTREGIYSLLKTRLTQTYGEPQQEEEKLIFQGENKVFTLKEDTLNVEFNLLDSSVKRGISGLITKLQALNI